MGEFRLQAGSVRLVANCGDELQEQVNWLLETMKKLYEQGTPMDDGERIQFGWALLMLKRHGGDIVLCEPDYAGNPFTDVVEDVTRTLWVQAQQVDILRSLGLAGNPARFQDKVVITKGCLDEPMIFLQRQDGTEPGDSGWFIGRVVEAKTNKEEYESLFVYQLLFARPALMQVMAMPSGYIVFFEENRLKSILDPQDRPVWPIKAG